MKKLLLGIATFALAFGILSVTYLRYSSVSYASNFIGSKSAENEKEVNIEYTLPYAGKINPDNTLWTLKALRDRAWFISTLDKQKKSELNLLFADKRLSSAKYLFENKKPDVGLSTLTKAEKYLEMAGWNLNSVEFAKKLAIASLKHRQIIENDLLPNAPEDIKPQIIKTLDLTKNTYKTSRDYLNSQNVEPPLNPFGE